MQGLKGLTCGYNILTYDGNLISRYFKAQGVASSEISRSYSYICENRMDGGVKKTKSIRNNYTAIKHFGNLSRLMFTFNPYFQNDDQCLQYHKLLRNLRYSIKGSGPSHTKRRGLYPLFGPSGAGKTTLVQNTGTLDNAK